MRVQVNGQPVVLPDGSSLQDLLRRMDVPPQGVAVARNLEVVPRARLARVLLSEGDRVELVRAVGGG